MFLTKKSLFKTDKFYEIRKLMIQIKYYDSRKIKQKPPIDKDDLWERQIASKHKRIDFFNDDPRIEEFFKWFLGLRKRANLSREQFCKAVNIAPRTYRAYVGWKFHGNFPYEATIKLALALEKTISIRTKRTKRSYRLRTNGKSIEVSENFLQK